ncbi:cell wall synthase accessory phosphoprotein MacP [Streptococcus ferus]|uniref:Membrane protein n=1 Tax=Streptococcus ferus TaxID=1345 RepID=A0A2X3VN75_9STRE|nr:cell wall synthase accessory phosphoprotein MacP [Streptococcus ferus]SQF40858.1 membrane protein [Streptococcus ferus]
MGKPLLTDEIIERARQGESIGNEAASFDSEETLVISTDNSNDGANREHVRQEEVDYLEAEDPIIKSRRIENAKRGEFQSKLNMILFAIVILLAILIYAVFKW